MRHRYASWAAAAVATAALIGCSSGGENDGEGVPLAGSTAAGVGAVPMTAGSTAMNPITGGPTTPTMTAGAVSPPVGTAGMMVMPPATGTAGAAGAMMQAGGGGAAGAMTAGASGMAGGMAGGAAGMMMAGAGGGMAAGPGSCGPATTVSAANLGNPMMRGPWTPTMKASSGASGRSTLFYPMELGKDGVKHPVFHWGCGAGSQPSQYADHLNLLASHGFVVIANASGSMPAKAALDWLLAENDKMGSMFYQKLDPMRVGTGGHSLGALETFQFAADPRLSLYVLVCGGSTSGTTGAANIHGPSIYLGGQGEGGTTNFANDYKNTTKAPSVFVTKTSTDHIACARNNLGPWVAFMRWNFCGEEAQWKKEFMPDGTYCKSPWLACQTKGLM